MQSNATSFLRGSTLSNNFILQVIHHSRLLNTKFLNLGRSLDNIRRRRLTKESPRGRSRRGANVATATSASHANGPGVSATAHKEVYLLHVEVASHD